MKFKVSAMAIAAALSLAPLVPHSLRRARAETDLKRVGRALAAYRDGDRWIAFTRDGRSESGRQWLTLRAGGRTFRGQVGAQAVVQLRAGLRAPRIARARLHRLGLRRLRPLSEALGIYQVAGHGGEDGAALAARLSHERDLDSVAPDLFTARKLARIDAPPNDPRYGGQWYLDTIDIEAAWRISSGARDVTVAIVDNGCDLAHPDLAAQFVAGRDAITGDDDPSYKPSQQGNAHGTACAGIVAAVANNGIGIAGTCPGCTLSCVRLLDNAVSQGIPLSADIEAFDFAFRSNAAVVSNSWGYVESIPVPSALAAAIQRVAEQGNRGRGAVVVFAAGNEGREVLNDELAALPQVLAVSTVTLFEEAAPYANRGASLDLAAPGGSLTTDISGPDGYDRGDITNVFGGTSAACPVVAGVAGLAMAAAPKATAAEVRQALITSARRAPYAQPDGQGHDPIYGFGIVDPAAALRALGASAPDAGATPDAGAVVSDASALDAADAQDGAPVAASDAAQPGQPQPTRADAASSERADASHVAQPDGSAGEAEAGEAEPKHEDAAPGEDAEPEDTADPVDDEDDEAYSSESEAVRAGRRGGEGCSLRADSAPAVGPLAWSGGLLALIGYRRLRRRAR